MKIIDVYLGRSILTTTFFSLLVLMIISTLGRFVDQINKVGQGTYDLTGAAIFTFYSMPSDVVMFFPMAALIGGLTGMGALASSSELVVMQAAGLSRFNIVSSVMKTALVMALVVMALGEWGAPAAQQKAKELRTFAISGGNVFEAKKGVWAKDGDIFVNIENVDKNGRLDGVNLYRFDESLQLRSTLKADYGESREQGWVLYDVTQVYVGETGVKTDFQERFQWITELTPEKLGVVSVKPESLSFSELFSLLDYLEQNQQDASLYQLALWRKVAQPLSIAVMLLLALSFIFGPLRSVTMGARVLLGVITGFLFWLSDEIFGPIALVYQLPPALGALLPSVLFFVTAVYFLRKS